MENSENLVVGLFENINDQIYDCDTLKLDGEYEIHRYVLKNGNVFDVPAYSNINTVVKKVQPLVEAFDRDLPQNTTELEQFCHQILDNIEAYFILKEFVRYTNFYRGESRIKGLDDDVIRAGIHVNNLLSMAADLSPIWCHKKAPKYPKLRYYDANPYNILGWDHKFDYNICIEDRNVIHEREVMLNLATSDVPITLTENQLFDCIYELRLANRKYEFEKKKVLM